MMQEESDGKPQSILQGLTMHSITNYGTQEGRFNLITIYNKKKEKNYVPQGA